MSDGSIRPFHDALRRFSARIDDEDEVKSSVPLSSSSPSHAQRSRSPMSSSSSSSSRKAKKSTAPMARQATSNSNGASMRNGSAHHPGQGQGHHAAAAAAAAGGHHHTQQQQQSLQSLPQHYQQPLPPHAGHRGRHPNGMVGAFLDPVVANLSENDLEKFVQSDILRNILAEDLAYESTKDTLCQLAERSPLVFEHAVKVLVELIIRHQITNQLQRTKANAAANTPAASATTPPATSANSGAAASAANSSSAAAAGGAVSPGGQQRAAAATAAQQQHAQSNGVHSSTNGQHSSATSSQQPPQQQQQQSPQPATAHANASANANANPAVSHAHHRHAHVRQQRNAQAAARNGGTGTGGRSHHHANGRGSSSASSSSASSQECSILHDYFGNLGALLEIADEATIGLLMEPLRKVFNHISRSDEPDNHAMNWLVINAEKSIDMQNWLLDHFEEWLADPLIASHSERVRRWAEQIARIVIPPDHPECIYPLLDLIPRCFHHVGPNSKLLQRKKDAPRLKPYKLASLFRLLRYFAKTPQHRQMIFREWKHLRRLLKAILDEEKDHDLELNMNKLCLYELIMKLLDEENTQATILDDFDSVSRILGGFINLRNIQESISYNEKMIPLTFELVGRCVKRNRNFIPHVLLPNHHTFEWSILKFSQTKMYPLSWDSVFEFVSTVCEHPEMDFWRQKRIKTALDDEVDKENPFAHSPIRLLSLFDVLIRTERDGEVFRENEGLRILERFLEQYREENYKPEEQEALLQLIAVVKEKANEGDRRLKLEQEQRAERAEQELLDMLECEEASKNRKRARKQRRRKKKIQQIKQKEEKAAKVKQPPMRSPKSAATSRAPKAPKPPTSSSSSTSKPPRRREDATSKEPKSTSSKKKGGSSSSSSSSAAVPSTSASVPSPSSSRSAASSSTSNSSSTAPSDSSSSSASSSSRNLTKANTGRSNPAARPPVAVSDNVFTPLRKETKSKPLNREKSGGGASASQKSTSTATAGTSRGGGKSPARPAPPTSQAAAHSQASQKSNKNRSNASHHHHHQDHQAPALSSSPHTHSRQKSSQKSTSSHTSATGKHTASSPPQAASKRASTQASQPSASTSSQKASKSHREPSGGSNASSGAQASHQQTKASQSKGHHPASAAATHAASAALPSYAHQAPPAPSTVAPSGQAQQGAATATAATTAGSDGWNLVADAQHKKLSRENKRLAEKCRQLEKLNKELTETLSQQKDAIQSSSSALQTEQDNHRKTAGDLAKIRANFEKLRRAHEEALAANASLDARCRELSNRRGSNTSSTASPSASTAAAVGAAPQRIGASSAHSSPSQRAAALGHGLSSHGGGGGSGLSSSSLAPSPEPTSAASHTTADSIILPLGPEQARSPFLEMCARSPLELATLSDNELEDLRDGMRKAHRQLFMWKADLDAACNNVTQAEKDRMCMICSERPLDCVLQPCGHKRVCQICAPRIAMCPVCSTRIQSQVLLKGAPSVGATTQGQQRGLQPQRSRSTQPQAPTMNGVLPHSHAPSSPRAHLPTGLVGNGAVDTSGSGTGSVTSSSGTPPAASSSRGGGMSSAGLITSRSGPLPGGGGVRHHYHAPPQSTSLSGSVSSHTPPPQLGASRAMHHPGASLPHPPSLPTHSQSSTLAGLGMMPPTEPQQYGVELLSATSDAVSVSSDRTASSTRDTLNGVGVGGSGSGGVGGSGDYPVRTPLTRHQSAHTSHSNLPSLLQQYPPPPGGGGGGAQLHHQHHHHHQLPPLAAAAAAAHQSQAAYNTTSASLESILFR